MNDQTPDRKPLKTYLLINVVVSALTTLLVLVLWSALTTPDLPDSSAASSSTLDATDTPGPTIDAGDYAGQLAISTIIGAGDVDNERVTIEHVGDTEISLAGWRLVDEGGNEYRFPALVLHPDGSVELYSRVGEDSVTQLYWNRTSAVWEESEEARLLDPNGDERATYTVP
jgi:hypothetical protein